MSNHSSSRYDPFSFPIVLALAVVGLVAASGCGESDAERLARLQREALAQKQRDAIKRLLDTDRALSRAFEQNGGNSGDFDKIVVAVRQYAQTIQALDTADLTPDVREAYVEHARAWRGLAAFLDNYAGLTGAFRRGWDGDGAKYKYEALTKAVKDSWDGVKAKAAGHGVDVAPYN